MEDLHAGAEITGDIGQLIVQEGQRSLLDRLRSPWYHLFTLRYTRLPGVPRSGPWKALMGDNEISSRPNLRSDPPLESTAVLIGRVQAGDATAREQLVARYLPILKRWAHGRLPPHARDLVDTGDLVQVTLLRALDHLGTFEPRREGAFLAYLRQTLMNLLRNEIRRSVHHSAQPISDDLVDERASLLDQVIGKEVIEDYEAGLATLPEAMQEAIILKLEFGFSHREIADAIGSPSPNAARMLVSRALVKLSKAMNEHR